MGCPRAISAVLAPKIIRDVWVCNGPDDAMNNAASGVRRRRVGWLGIGFRRADRPGSGRCRSRSSSCRTGLPPCPTCNGRLPPLALTSAPPTTDHPGKTADLIDNRMRVELRVLPDYLWADCGHPERLTRVAHRVGLRWPHQSRQFRAQFKEAPQSSSQRIGAAPVLTLVGSEFFLQ